MRRLAVSLIVLIAAALPSAASAQAPPVEPAAVPAPLPVQTQLTLKLERIGGLRATVLAGSPVRVRGTTGTFVPGQQIIVRAYIQGRKQWAKRVSLLPRADGGGGFTLSYRPPVPGSLSIRATHEPSAALGALSARGTTVDVLPRRVVERSGKRSIRALQRRLRALGYVTGEPGVFDARTARAVLAFRKVAGMARTSQASIHVMRAIAAGKGRFKVRFPQHGRHIEGDLTRQVIALIDRGRVLRIYPTSSGKPSTPTILGSFRVYLKTPGTNDKGMVHSAYFIRGYATHGYKSVPIYPASAGCFRVPIPDALSLYNWIRIGTPVDVYK
ncbi:MAG: L,D-transpeptidase family protein [Solirubrobacteraceae bacterium]|nr:L,D-transpeptidase family protein [Solirubrobacteraceae bacterium]